MIIKQFTFTATEEFTNITSQVQDFITEQGIKEGICLVYSKHTTTCIRLIEPETLLKKDMHDFLQRLAPDACYFRHDDLEHRDVPPDERRNGFSHLRAMLLNHQETIPIINGKLDLGKWQQIFYIECDFVPPARERTFNIALIWANIE